MYIFIRSLVGLCLEMSNYHEKNSHSSMAFLMARIFLSIVTTMSVTSNNKKRAVTVYTMMTILLLSVVIHNQNPSIPLAYAAGGHKDNKADNNNQVAHLGGTQDKGNGNNNNIVDNSNSGETPSTSSTQPIIPTTQLTPST